MRTLCFRKTLLHASSISSPPPPPMLGGAIPVIIMPGGAIIAGCCIICTRQSGHPVFCILTGLVRGTSKVRARASGSGGTAYCTCTGAAIGAAAGTWIVNT